MTYVIGDVHGNFSTLKDLIKSFPKKSSIIFVGDLIDRGKNSRKIVKYIRENNYKCVLGNHELLMINNSSDFFKKSLMDINLKNLETWISVGGKETLLSYGLIDVVDDKIVRVSKSKYMDNFISDVKWMQSLPLYFETKQKINDKKVIISHSCISNVWKSKKDKDFEKKYKSEFIWQRDTPDKSCKIFNIFGHTKVIIPTVYDNYINIDTGCYEKNEKYGKLTAFCIENQEVICIQKNIKDE